MSSRGLKTIPRASWPAAAWVKSATLIGAFSLGAHAPGYAESLDVLRSVPTASFETVGLGGPLAVQLAEVQAAPAMDAAHRNKLLSFLRKHGARSGLYAQTGVILGLYNRGQNILVFRMHARGGKTIRTFGRIVMRHRELYYWGVQPDVAEPTTYFFLTDWQFKLVGVGAELVGNQATALSPPRSAAMFAQLTEDWITILDEL